MGKIRDGDTLLSVEDTNSIMDNLNKEIYKAFSKHEAISNILLSKQFHDSIIEHNPILRLQDISLLLTIDGYPFDIEDIPTHYKVNLQTRPYIR